jgi:prevent-host-death family protein
MKIQTMTSARIQNNFGSVVNIVKGGDPVAVTQYGTPTLMILPYGIAEEALHAYNAKKMIDFMNNMPPSLPGAPDLNLAEINALVHELRP